ncbi:hypothetical protein FRC06_000002 [Ceratobasidium sp. 370]|nr:hypothetical protein FRC06_000002 [Ceratobasidium sp. 370]
MSGSPLPTRHIGKDNVPALGFGAMTIGNMAYGKGSYSQEERFKVTYLRLSAGERLLRAPCTQVLDKLLELGCTHWDTADVYVKYHHLLVPDHPR